MSNLDEYTRTAVLGISDGLNDSHRVKYQDPGFVEDPWCIYGTRVTNEGRVFYEPR